MSQHAPTLLIINGKGAGDELVRAAVQKLRDAGDILHVRVTWEGGDAARYVKEALQLGVGTLIAGGGDGTINEVAAALAQMPAGQRPVLGILPLGTANDFATACNIPLVPEQALNLAIKGRAVPIDLACVNGERYFINMATGGFGTRITTETPEKLKAALGGVSYFIHGLLRMDRVRFLSLSEVSPPETLIQQHYRIFDALKAHDPDAAERAVHDHLQEMIYSITPIALQNSSWFEVE